MRKSSHVVWIVAIHHESFSQVYDCGMIINDKTKNALSKALVPSAVSASAYYLVMCSVFNMDKNICLVGGVSLGVVVFVSLSLLYRR